jgi:serine/threonine protein kinase/WD40 repeat protein
MKPNETRVLELLAAALKLTDQNAVDDFLSTACDGNQELIEKVLTLLDAYHRPSTTPTPRRPEQETGPSDETIIAAIRRTETAGTVIDRYRLLEQMGEGGMGTVWMAEQMAPMQRRVALKVIRYGMDSANVLARFEAERQALALMDHANIAKVLDAGTTPAGRPYFVMELVKGIPITTFCDEKRLSIRERLELFIPVCQAIQHAHQKGVIHRDIKPSNVLVTLYDGRPFPKVIDFGIAKATGQRLTQRTLFTELGALVGTPEYMSPEQAELNQLDIDTRSDVYGLGVLLYELLTGSTPISRDQFHKAAFDEILRRIREEEPAKPSTRLSESKDRLPSISAQRKLLPPQLTSLVRGDIDSIVMKALEKDRTRRYETANGLAMDIQRYLKDEAITARAATPRERAMKWIKRRPAIAALAGASVVAAFVCGILAVYASREALLATHNAAEAAVARKKAEATANGEILQRRRAEAALLEARRASYEANIHAADAYLNANEVIEAKRRLSACSPALRNWEWNHLHFKSDSSVRSFDLNENGSGGVCTLSPDGNWTAAALENGSVKLWNADSGEAAAMTEGVQWPRCIAFNHDGKLLAAGSLAERTTNNSPKVRVWRMAPLQEIATFDLPAPEGATALAFTDDNTGLLVGSGSWVHMVRNDPESGAVFFGKGLLRMFSLDARQQTRVLGEHPDPIRFIGVLGDGKTVVTGSDAKTATWRLTSAGSSDAGRERAFVDGEDSLTDTNGSRLLAMVPESNRLLELVQKNGAAEIVDLFSGKVFQHPAIQGSVAHWAIDSRLNQMAFSEGNLFKAWNLTETNRSATYLGHDYPIESLTLSQDGGRALSCDRAQAKLWDTTESQPFVVLRPAHSRESIRSVVFGPQPGSVIAADSGGIVRSWDTQTRVITSELKSPRGSIDQLVMSSHGNITALAHMLPERAIEVWDFSAHKLLQTLHPPDSHRGWIQQISLAPDGKAMVLVIWGAVQIWDPVTGQMRTNIAKPLVERAVLSTDGTSIAVVGADLQLWDANSLQSVTLTNNAPRATYVLFDQKDSQMAVTSGQDIYLWDVKHLKLKGQLQGHGHRVNCLAFSPDGNRLISGGEDGAVRVWDTETQSLLLTLREHTHEVTSVAVSPDGKQLASASVDGSVIIWNSEFPRTGSAAERHRRQIGQRAGQLLDQLLAEYFTWSNVVKQLESDDSISREVRDEAIRLARARDDGNLAQELNESSWETVSVPGREHSEYERALRQAQAACAVQKNALILNTLGVAYYRAGRFEDALATLADADRLNTGLYSRATDLLFMAMAHHQAGRSEKARDLLAQGRPLFANDDFHGFLDEAEALINGRTQ